jgi:molybdopterin-containing oxidoreductase family membrane subunit
MLMSKPTYQQIDGDVALALRPARWPYLLAVALLGLGATTALWVWVYQVRSGMGVAGINQPVGWGVYIANFVFWVGIAHSGTLISAILHLLRSKWRTAVSRSAEAMTIFAVMTAGLFPLIHLGRVWVFYFILPYPSERQVWPNFVSPLVWDICAISTYFTVSLIFWSVGMIPDLASLRDRYEVSHGRDHLRTRFYRFFSLGWTGAGSQWWHYGRSYLFFAALATPLVISVHSVVSWDFAMSIMPGWHTTIFAPYFVAGAIHQGLGMVLVLLIPMRKLLHLERLITIDNFEAVGKTMIVTTLIVGYAYVLEPWTAWYSHDKFEWQYAVWRATGYMAPEYWALTLLNVLVPLALLFKRVRRNMWALFTIGALVNVGMWLERYVIVPGGTTHDYLPHNWGHYTPTWVEWTLTTGAFCWFAFWFFIFAKFLPTVPTSESKAQVAGLEHDEAPRVSGLGPVVAARQATSGVVAVFAEVEPMVAALEKVAATPYRRTTDTFSPFKIDAVPRILGWPTSPVRYWTLAGALTGMASGFALAAGSAHVNDLIVGGKPWAAWIPYCVVGFEGTILVGTLVNFTGLWIHTRLGRWKLPRGYDRRFSADKFAIVVGCPPERTAEVRALLEATKPEETYDF